MWCVPLRPQHEWAQGTLNCIKSESHSGTKHCWLGNPRTKWKFYLEIHWTCGIFQHPIINSENKLRWNCTCNCNYYLSHLKIYLSHEIHEVCHPVSLQFLWVKGAPFEVPYDPGMFHARGDRDQNWAAWHSLAVSRGIAGAPGVAHVYYVCYLCMPIIHIYN